MKLKFSCADFSFPGLEYDKKLALISLLDVKGVDVGLFEWHDELNAGQELVRPQKNGARLLRRMQANGLTVADIFLQLGNSFEMNAVNHPVAKTRKHARENFLKTMDYSHAAGSNHITILPGIHFKDESLLVSMDRSIDELAWRVEKAKEGNLKVSIEPHVGSFLLTPEKTISFIKQVPGLGVTLDYSHFTYQGISDERVEALIPFATHFHVRTARKRRLQCGMLENTIDFSKLVSQIGDCNFKGSIAFEYVWINRERCNEVDVLSETLQLKGLLETCAGKIL